MTLLLMSVIGALAAIGLLTLVAIGTVIKFGDDHLSKLKAW
jgi:hypothetical protein